MINNVSSTTVEKRKRGGRPKKVTEGESQATEQQQPTPFQERGQKKQKNNDLAHSMTTQAEPELSDQEVLLKKRMKEISAFQLVDPAELECIEEEDELQIQEELKEELQEELQEEPISEVFNDAFFSLKSAYFEVEMNGEQVPVYSVFDMMFEKFKDDQECQNLVMPIDKPCRNSGDLKEKRLFKESKFFNLALMGVYSQITQPAQNSKGCNQKHYQDLDDPFVVPEELSELSIEQTEKSGSLGDNEERKRQIYNDCRMISGEDYEQMLRQKEMDEEQALLELEMKMKDEEKKKERREKAKATRRRNKELKMQKELEELQRKEEADLQEEEEHKQPSLGEVEINLEDLLKSKKNIGRQRKAAPKTPANTQTISKKRARPQPGESSIQEPEDGQTKAKRKRKPKIQSGGNSARVVNAFFGT